MYTVKVSIKIDPDIINIMEQSIGHFLFHKPKGFLQWMDGWMDGTVDESEKFFGNELLDRY